MASLNRSETAAGANVNNREFYCRKCRMKFDAKEKLANHINKYCVDSVYGEPQKLLKQLKLEQEAERNTSTHLSFGEIREFLENNQHHGMANRVGKMSLHDLRTRMNTQGVDADLEALKSEIIKRRENELIRQLQELKKSEQELIMQRKNNETKLSEKLQLFQQEQEQTLKMRLETERVSRIISSADREDLNALNAEKRKELEHLKELRLSLEEQEQKAMQGINELNEKIKKEEQLFQQRKDEILKIRNKKGAQFQQMKMKIMQNAQKHAAYSAKLKVEQEQLEQPKRALTEQLKDNKLNEQDQTVILNEVQNQYTEQFNAINALKQQFESETEEMTQHMLVHDELFQKLTSFPDTVDLNDYFLPEQRQKLLENAQNTQKQHEQKQKQTKTEEFVTEEMEEQIEEKKEEDTPSTVRNHSERKTRSREKPQATLDLDESDVAPTPPKRQRTFSPPLHSEKHANYAKHNHSERVVDGGHAQSMPPPPSHPPHAPYPPHMPPQHTVPPPHPHAYGAGVGYGAYAPYQAYPAYNNPAFAAYAPSPPPPPAMDMSAHPMMQQLSEQFKMTQKLLAQHELENELLQHELKSIHSKQEQDKTRASQREFTQTMNMLKSKLLHNHDDTESQEVSEVQIGGFHELRDFEKEERKLLTLIATFDHDAAMKKIYTEQLRTMYVHRTTSRFPLRLQIDIVCNDCYIAPR